MTYKQCSWRNKSTIDTRETVDWWSQTNYWSSHQVAIRLRWCSNRCTECTQHVRNLHGDQFGQRSHLIPSITHRAVHARPEQKWQCQSIYSSTYKLAPGYIYIVTNLLTSSALSNCRPWTLSHEAYRFICCIQVPLTSSVISRIHR